MVELILSKWPTLCCFCRDSPLDADFWLHSCCYFSRFFYGLILWVPELFADIQDIKNYLDTVMKCQSQVGQCWTPAGIFALGLAPSSSETVKDLSRGLDGLGPTPGSSACPAEPCDQVSRCWSHSPHPVAGRHKHPCNGRVPGGKKPCDLPGWELLVTLI